MSQEPQIKNDGEQLQRSMRELLRSKDSCVQLSPSPSIMNGSAYGSDSIP